ncbi:MAG: ribosome maturation factor RimP [Chiayiivirga sp.]|jgi:ribosome maturation factor RimP|uniref:ribosome maturation factor RimP n=1 Tax=Chiayiivirga sp. TaxID=2041042 RepID=UPI0025BB8FA1|nr:ribosome maturation factor RimP [Chiayiivirga sp.]MCI1730792.1 ribosome maturation factor RimP [Chiayiivirga sp.]
MSQKQHEIEALLAPAVQALGLELLGSEFSAGNASALLRLYIDARDRAVNLDDCEAVSREVSALLDVHDPIDGNYTLEVSSPGIERPLFKPEHFARFAGEPAKVTVDLPIDGRRRFHGPILRVEGDEIVLEQDGIEVRVPHPNIIKARLAPVFEAPAKPGKKPGQKPGRKTPKD